MEYKCPVCGVSHNDPPEKPNELQLSTCVPHRKLQAAGLIALVELDATHVDVEEKITMENARITGRCIHIPTYIYHHLYTSSVPMNEFNIVYITTAMYDNTLLWESTFKPEYIH